MVGYEYHLTDSDLDAGIGIYHQTVEDYKNNVPFSKCPIIKGDKWFIFHDEKDMYTGFTDKKNVEIYDLDIMEYKDERFATKEEMNWANGSWYCGGQRMATLCIKKYWIVKKRENK